MKLSKSFLYITLASIAGYLISFFILKDFMFDSCSVQDDFRQTNFWFWSFWDESLFQNDIFTNGYQVGLGLAPLYLMFFKVAPLFTDDLILYSKVYAFVMAIFSTIAAYLFYRSFDGRSHFSAFAFSSFMTFIFWTTDHLSSAHVRASVWLVIFLFLWARFSKRDIVSSLICSFSLFFNPTTFLLCYGAEGLCYLADKKLNFIKIIKDRSSRIGFLIFNALMTLVFHFIVRGGVKYNGVGESFSRDELKTLVELNPGGRHPVFGTHLLDGSWWKSEHFGIGIGYLAISKIFLVAGIALIAFLIYKSIVEKKKINLSFNPFLALVSSSLLLYVLSQLLFPLLYMPSRYIAIPSLLLAAIILFYCIDYFSRVFIEKIEKLSLLKSKVHLIILRTFIMSSLVLLFVYAFKESIHMRYVKINPSVRKIALNLPKDSLIAAYPLLPDINSLSIFSKRNVFIDYERSLSYTKSTLVELRRRNFIALAMTYSSSKEEFIKLAKENGITHFLALIDYYSPKYLKSARYINPYNKFLRKLVSKKNFFLKDYLIQRNQRYVLIDISKLDASVQR